MFKSISPKIQELKEQFVQKEEKIKIEGNLGGEDSDQAVSKQDCGYSDSDFK